jgi:hypothetical protein
MREAVSFGELSAPPSSCGTSTSQCCNTMITIGLRSWFEYAVRRIATVSAALPRTSRDGFRPVFALRMEGFSPNPGSIEPDPA